MTNTINGEKHDVPQPIHPSMIDRLDPAFVKLYNENIANTPAKPIELVELRKTYSTLYSFATAQAPEVAQIYDSTIAIDPRLEIDVRVYEPETPGPWPVHFNFHGGGWALGDLDTEAHVCKHICHKAKVAVIDVAYRLVPEVPFPAGITDSFAVVKSVYEHGADKFNIDSARISLGGASAGACIALFCAHLARDEGIPIKLIAAGQPAIDDMSKYLKAADSPWKSMQENQFAPTLNWARMRYFHYIKNKSVPKDQKGSLGWYNNLFEAPCFTNLPRTVIFTAGADPLRDEGERYGHILAENGNEVVLKRYPGVPHPFMYMDKDLWQARDFIDRTARETRVALHNF